MNTGAPAGDAAAALRMLAVDPEGLGGAVLTGMPGPWRDAWLESLRAALPPDTPWRRIPVHVDDDRLLGGLDVAASLAAGRPVVATGLLAEADRGVAVLPMAERLSRGTRARIAAAMDRGEVVVERDGVTRRLPARFAVIALDEALENDEPFGEELSDRLAFRLRPEDVPEIAPWRGAEAARKRLAAVEVDDALIEALCATSLALGIVSLRGAWLALRAARAAAAVAGRDAVDTEDVRLAARLVLAPRARQFPADEDSAEAEPPPQEETPRDEAEPPNPADGTDIPEDVILAAVKASLPPNLLARLQAAAGRQWARGRRSRGGAPVRARRRGRPIGVRPGGPGGGNRLHVAATLKAAAPWQRLRAAGDASPETERRVRIRSEDFHVTRFKSRRETTTIFVVDASGSSAAHRLAEAKGAVELLLAESYVRRDQVSLIAFRGAGAEVLLPPTRALARARRELAALPGGGGTPLAAGLDRARELAADLERRGIDPVIVLMTDGRANVARDGSPGHALAEDEALASARLLRAEGTNCILVDTSRRPRPRARALAEAMGAIYLPLPHADAASLSQAVQSTAGAS